MRDVLEKTWVVVYVGILGKTKKAKFKEFCKKNGIEVKWEAYFVGNISVTDYNLKLVKTFFRNYK